VSDLTVCVDDRSAQALSKEILLSNLLKTLMEVMLEVSLWY